MAFSTGFMARLSFSAAHFLPASRIGDLIDIAVG
jgi:hypothetical protein